MNGPAKFEVNAMSSLSGNEQKTFGVVERQWSSWNSAECDQSWPLTCGDWINSVQYSKCHGCWCPGSLRRQDFSTHDIDYDGQGHSCVPPTPLVGYKKVFFKRIHISQCQHRHRLWMTYPCLRFLENNSEMKKKTKREWFPDKQT